MTNYPCVPGHELAGVVTAVGRRVGKYKVVSKSLVGSILCVDPSPPQVGDTVGVGCVSDCCMNCACKWL